MKRYICTNQGVELGVVFAKDKDDARNEFRRYCGKHELKGVRYFDIRVKLLK